MGCVHCRNDAALVCCIFAEDAGLQAMLLASETQRLYCYAALRAKSHELQSLMLRLALWNSGAYFEQQDEATAQQF